MRSDEICGGRSKTLLRREIEDAAVIADMEHDVSAYWD